MPNPAELPIPQDQGLMRRLSDVESPSPIPEVAEAVDDYLAVLKEACRAARKKFPIHAR